MLGNFQDARSREHPSMLDVKAILRLARPNAIPCPDLDTEVKGIDGDELDIGTSRRGGISGPPREIPTRLHPCL